MKNKEKIKTKGEKLLGIALKALYELEDKTEYKNKNVSNAINLLQKEVK